MNTTDNQRLSEITARCDAATPGAWKVIDKGNSVRSFAVVSVAIDGRAQQMLCPNMSPKTTNADFIAHSREDIPYLLSVISEQERTIAAAVSDLKIHAGCDICHSASGSCEIEPCKSCVDGSMWQWKGRCE